MENEKKICKKCHGTGVVKEKNGFVHTCYDCLSNQSEIFDQHGNPRETGIKW